MTLLVAYKRIINLQNILVMCSHMSNAGKNIPTTTASSHLTLGLSGGILHAKHPFNCQEQYLCNSIQ